VACITTPPRDPGGGWSLVYGACCTWLGHRIPVTTPWGRMCIWVLGFLHNHPHGVLVGWSSYRWHGAILAYHLHCGHGHRIH
jgi:hypothetical protein